MPATTLREATHVSVRMATALWGTRVSVRHSLNVLMHWDRLDVRETGQKENLMQRHRQPSAGAGIGEGLGQAAETEAQADRGRDRWRQRQAEGDRQKKRQLYRQAEPVAETEIEQEMMEGIDLGTYKGRGK